MAAPLMQGFTMDDYVLADQLGYTREQFEGMGQSEMRNMLTKKTPQKSYVQPTSVVPQMRKQSNVPLPEETNYMTGQTVNAEPVNLVNAPNNNVSLPGDMSITEETIIDTSVVPKSTVPAITAGEQSLIDSRNASTALDQEMLKQAQGFDWMGAANVGFQGLNTAMQVGMYGDQKDYMQNVNKGLEQNMKNAQATHDNRATQQQNLGSTFSRNA